MLHDLFLQQRRKNCGSGRAGRKQEKRECRKNLSTRSEESEQRENRIAIARWGNISGERWRRVAAAAEGGGGAAGTGRRGNESLCKDIQRAFLSEFRTFIFPLIPNLINFNRPRSAAERLIIPRFMSILTPKNTREKVQHVSRLLERGKKV